MKKALTGLAAYERSLDDERNGRVNHYASSEEFFKKNGNLMAYKISTTHQFGKNRR